MTTVRTTSLPLRRLAAALCAAAATFATPADAARLTRADVSERLAEFTMVLSTAGREAEAKLREQGQVERVEHFDGTYLFWAGRCFVPVALTDPVDDAGTRRITSRGPQTAVGPVVCN